MNICHFQHRPFRPYGPFGGILPVSPEEAQEDHVTEEPEYLTVSEIATRQRVGQSLVKRALASGALVGHQVGDKRRWRIAVEAYRDWVARGAPSSKQEPTQ